MEEFDLYDRDRNPLGLRMARNATQPDDTFRIVVHCCIFNSQGKLLIQRRQDFKQGWSGMWDITCGGGSIAGENSQAAVHRELLEELGLDVDFSSARPVLTVHFKGGFDDIYILNWDVKLCGLTLQPEEVAEAKWADESEVLRMIDEGIFIPYHKSFISLLFAMQHGRDIFRDKAISTPT